MGMHCACPSIGSQPVVLIATHPPALMDSKTWENSNEHLRELARYVRDLSDPVIVAGDLNITIWSLHFDDPLEQSTLYETRDSYGVHPTFPASRWGLDLPWPLLRGVSESRSTYRVSRWVQGQSLLHRGCS